MPEGRTRVTERQALLPGMSLADALTAARIPLAVAFPLVSDASSRAIILGLAAATDMLDGAIARRFGASRLGVFLDPVADKLFMAFAFGTVLVEGGLHWLEVLGVMLRALVATGAFIAGVAKARGATIAAAPIGTAV